MSNLFDRINLLEGLNISTVPLEISNNLSNTEILMEIQAKVDQIINVGNAWAVESNKYTDVEVAKIKTLYESIISLINSGDIIKDGTIDINKMDMSFLNELQSIVIKFVHDSTKFVAFSIDRNGYFVADMPDTWNDIIFSTDIDGHLCLDVI